MNRIMPPLIALALAGCSNTVVSDDQRTTGTPVSSPSASPTSTQGPEGTAKDFGFPRGPFPDSARVIAREFRVLSPQLLSAIMRWRKSGGGVRSPLGEAIALAALRRQKILRTLAKDEALERRVLDRLPRVLDREISVHTAASRALASLVSPVSGRFHLPTKQPDPVHRLRRIYEAGERRYGVPWELLASINLVETRFGRLTGPSTAGAQGPMQFIPSTWAIYGRGDINDAHDAIMAAARYLVASGAPSDLRSAVFSYNHSDAYVQAILTYFEEMKRDPRNYYSYYFWQVFVRTTKGDVQLTGPGGRRSHIR